VEHDCLVVEDVKLKLACRFLQTSCPDPIAARLYIEPTHPNHIVINHESQLVRHI
jgi:hypothetical protein